MFKSRKNLFNLGLLGIFIWLLITSYSSSKRKPETVGELFKDFSWLSDWPKWLDLPLMPLINKMFKSLNENYGFIFEAINNVLLAMLMGLKNFLVQAPWPLVIIGVIILAYYASGKKIKTTVAVGFCTFFIGFLHPRFWDKAIETTSIMLISIFLCLVIGVPIGIWMSRANRVREKILPILDLMQTIPAFVYLIPGIMLFGLGAVPAIIATFIYAVPPLVRLTDLGIRLVDTEVTEAADAFGASKKQKLWGVQIPLALPNIMQGVNQCTMMALSMVVIASMIGTRGLGDEVLLGLQQLNVGRAAEAGIAIVLLAIVLDRITQSYGETLQERNSPTKELKK